MGEIRCFLLAKYGILTILRVGGSPVFVRSQPVNHPFQDFFVSVDTKNDQMLKKKQIATRFNPPPFNLIRLPNQPIYVWAGHHRYVTCEILLRDGGSAVASREATATAVNFPTTHPATPSVTVRDSLPENGREIPSTPHRTTRCPARSRGWGWVGAIRAAVGGEGAWRWPDPDRTRMPHGWGITRWQVVCVPRGSGSVTVGFRLPSRFRASPCYCQCLCLCACEPDWP
jgi:hypothetical protein